MGDHGLPERVMSGEVENAGQHGPRWIGERMDVGCLASRGTGVPPH